MLISFSPVVRKTLMTPTNPGTHTECGIDHMVQRLYIHWDITTRCNFCCPYCYAKQDYQDEWQRTDTWSQQQLVISAIKAAKLPIFIGLLGGEPTLHPRFNTIVDSVLDACWHKQSRLYITTNGSIKKLQTIPFNSKVRILMSLHPGQEYLDPGFQKFFNNLECMISKGFKIRVNLMLDPTFMGRSLDIYNVLKRYSVEIHPHFIYKSQLENASLVGYNFDALKMLSDAAPEYLYDDMPMNDFEIFSRGLNRFKGWQCWNNNYEITWDGRVQNLCAKKEVDLASDPLFFHRITTISPMQCPYDECVCDGLLKTMKARSNVLQHSVSNI